MITRWWFAGLTARSPLGLDIGGGTYESTQWDFYDDLVHNGDGTWTVTMTNLDVYQFDAADGRLITITDKNGNTSTLAYTNGDFPGAVTEVTDPAGPGESYAEL